MNAKLEALEARVGELETKNCTLEGRLEQLEQENEEYKDVGEKLTRRLERLKKYTIQSNAIMREMLFPVPAPVEGTKERTPQRRVSPPSTTGTTESQESSPTDTGEETETEEEKSKTLTQENCRGLLAIKKMEKATTDEIVTKSILKVTAAARKDARANNASTKAEKYHSKAAKRILSKLASEKAAKATNCTSTEEGSAEMSTQQLIKRSKVSQSIHT